jgi:hypothetical protein
MFLRVMAEASPATDRLRRALAWAIDASKEVPGVLSTRDLARLDEALSRDAPFPTALYPKLQLFAQILWRVPPPAALPRLGLGDALEAVAERASSLTPWPFAAAVEAQTFRALGYDDNASGLDRERARHREGWAAHGEASRRFIGEALGAVGGGGVAWVLGAGRAYDLPLDELGARFDKVVLADIDGAALEATLATVEPSRRARFELVAADLTGIAGTWRARTNAAIAGALDAREAADRLGRLFASYAVVEESPWRLLGERADLIVSQMVLSQLNDFLERFPRQLYAARFGASLHGRHPELRVANMLFAHRVQHDHLRFLRRHAGAAVLTSDVSEQLERLAPGGVLEPVGDELPLLGAYHLAERVPVGFQVDEERQWTWARVVPTPAHPRGSRMRVTALRLAAAGR